MPYMQDVCRENKALFVFLLDQSYSMEQPLGGSGNRKMDELAAAINRWLMKMVIRATGSAGVKDWMDIGVLGYRTDSEAETIIESLLGGALAGKELVSICEIAENPSEIKSMTRTFYYEDLGETSEMEVEVPIWVQPVAEGGTPMCAVLDRAHEVVAGWIKDNPQNFPPIVIHITDGGSQDGDPVPHAMRLMDLATEDGNVLILNCHLSEIECDPFMYPLTTELLPGRESRVLFNMSSVLPESICTRANDHGFEMPEGARAMVFNADMVSLIKFLDMGMSVVSPMGARGPSTR